MQDIRDLMTGDHRSCDDRLVAVEQAVLGGDWATARNRFAAFRDAVMAHFNAEESVLFPLFEQRTGIHRGPTQVMRSEHLQIRQLLATTETALEQADGEEYQGAAETLLIMIQQHNMKEESILYPMCDQHLADQRETLLPELRRQIGRQSEETE